MKIYYEHINRTYHSTRSLLGFLHLPICSFAEGLQKLVAVFEVVFVVVPLHGLSLQGHLGHRLTKRRVLHRGNIPSGSDA